ncbi:9979_t:CDS:2 [Acaulospora morrowiae]|uniref:9979_t:CDS:1 n=1 Tax=Acaulospora morrowiae TaxID=94023 RepID=A0A9N8VJN5_9GLOM|nr:9979_t:CDS:2 [Acaulospora morrowiae]
MVCGVTAQGFLVLADTRCELQRDICSRLKSISADYIIVSRILTGLLRPSISLFPRKKEKSPCHLDVTIDIRTAVSIVTILTQPWPIYSSFLTTLSTHLIGQSRRSREVGSWQHEFHPEAIPDELGGIQNEWVGPNAITDVSDDSWVS